MEQTNSHIKDAVRVGQAFLEQYDNSDSLNHCWHLYDALLQLTATHLEQGIDAKDCRFDYQELYKYISEKNDGYKATDDPKKKVSSLYRSLEKILSETPSDHISRQLDLKVRPKLQKHSQPGRGHKASLWIAAESLKNVEEKLLPAESENTPNRQPHSAGQIEYYLEKTPRLPIWSRWAQDMEFKGRLRAALIIYAILPAALLISISISLMLTPFVQAPFLLYIALYSMVGLVIFYLFFGSILKAFKNNITIVPEMMIPLRLHSAVFELDIEKDPKKIGQRIKKLNIKVYSAKCPICESKVHLKKGGLMHWGRIIGECDLNPVEHIYSFDHTNFKGHSLR